MFTNKIHKKNICLISGFIFIIFWLFPIWNMQDLAVFGDGNNYLAGIESFKVSILDYKQFPQNSPWQRGGRPESIYLISPISIKFWFFIIFETKTALSLYLLFCFIILFYGSYKVAGFYFRKELFKFFFALLSIFNIALIFHLKAGHYIFLSFCYFPLILYFLFKYKTYKFAGVFSGYLFGLMLDDDLAYMSSYCILILGIFVINFFLNFKNDNRKKLLYWIYFFSLTSVCVVGYKLNIFYEIRAEFPRSDGSGYFSNILSLLKSYLIPYYDLQGGVFNARRFCESTWENSVYIGLIAFLFIYYSFKNKLNSAHYILIFLMLLQLGTLPLLPYGLLQNFPIFESHVCYNRVRVFNSFYFSFLILFGFLYISKNKDYFQKKYLKIYEYRNYLIIFILIERLFSSHLLMYNTYRSYENLNNSRYDSSYKTYNILKKYKNNKEFFNYSILPPYEAIKQKIGIMRYGGDSYLPYIAYGDENYLGQFAIDEKEYQGEFSIDKKSVKPGFWSPNIIEFTDLDLGKKLKLNMNPNRGWMLNGVPLFPNNKVWEPNKEFIVDIKESYLKFEYKQPGKTRGTIVNVLAIILLLISIVKLRNHRSKNNS